jgi:hypothetical protein
VKWPKAWSTCRMCIQWPLRAMIVLTWRTAAIFPRNVQAGV